MVWYDNKEYSLGEVATFPKWTLTVKGEVKEALYVLVRKGEKLVGGPVIPKSRLTKAVKNTTLPDGQVEIQDFAWNFLNRLYTHPEEFIPNKEEQGRIRRLTG